MQPDETAFICVTYQSAWQGNSSRYSNQYLANGTYQFAMAISKEHCATRGSCNSTLSHSFVVSGFPSSIQPSAATDYVTVVYTVTALSNSTGFYDSSAPFDYCVGMPMAVGYAASEVGSSDFAPRVLPPCPFLQFTPFSVSVGGMYVIYLAL
jgi:hypothetical protein